MTKPETQSLTMDERIAAACRDAAEQAVARAEQTGTGVIIWKDGQIVCQTAAEARAALNALAEKGTAGGEVR